MLGIVIVGLAVVVGIESFQENARKSSYDTMTAQAVGYAGKMIEWKMKPGAQGGGQSASNMNGFTLANLGMVGGGAIDFHDLNGGDWAQSADTYVSLHGMNSGSPHVAVYDAAKDIMVAVFVFGNSPDCLVQRISYMQGESAVYEPSVSPSNPDATNCTF
ncbi:MAG: hypothetical protein AAGF99_00555 [Bacteroidota bacterium]